MANGDSEACVDVARTDGQSHRSANVMLTKLCNTHAEQMNGGWCADRHTHTHTLCKAPHPTNPATELTEFFVTTEWRYARCITMTGASELERERVRIFTQKNHRKYVRIVLHGAPREVDALACSFQSIARVRSFVYIREGLFFFFCGR